MAIDFQAADTADLASGLLPLFNGAAGNFICHRLERSPLDNSYSTMSLKVHWLMKDYTKAIQKKMSGRKLPSDCRKAIHRDCVFPTSMTCDTSALSGDGIAKLLPIGSAPCRSTLSSLSVSSIVEPVSGKASL